MNLHLEHADDPLTLQFVAERDAKSEQALMTPEFEADSAAIKALIEREDRLIQAVRRGNWLFDFHRSPDHPLGMWFRLPAGLTPLPNAPWEPIFDLDAFCAAENKLWLWRGAITCPWEPTRVLLCLSDGGSDLGRLLEFDCEAKSIVEGGFDTPPARCHATWLSRDEIAYFGSIDRLSSTRSGWPRVGRRLKRGQPPAKAPLLYATADTDVYGSCLVFDPVLAGIAKKGTAKPIRLFITGHQIGNSSVFVKEQDFSLRRVDLPKDIDVHLSYSYCLWLAKTDERIPAGSLAIQPLPRLATDAGAEAMRVLFVPGERQSVSQFLLMREWCVFVVSDNLRPRLFVFDLTKTDAGVKEIPLPTDVQTVTVWPLYSDLHLGDDTLQVYGEGFLQPPSCYRLDLADRRKPLELVHTASSPAYFDTDGMTSELLEATSEDGTRVPYRLVLPKTWTDGELPVLMYGYGGFDFSVRPQYSGVIGRWLEQGGAYVQAYIRGGGELGPNWHRSAKRHGRHRAFADFAAVARDLVARGYTKPSRIAANGGSNGGLLTGVMLTRYPRDFGAIWCQVPVLDMTRFHVFPAGQAWIDEYGNPDDQTDRDYLLSYSPLQNLKPASEIAYPPIYIESSSNDDRVHPSHARRFAARMEDLGHHPLFHEFHSGGHGGDGASTQLAARIALGYSFLRETIVKLSDT
ncbi:prolyl oligopeptidase family serine peptidase [Rhizobium jaguaris]|uniref:prolyl oligopeptidase family serine peptidase n=1 Tax=Rhizobium jaguaris TaxID=1312183 RepID=UPI0039BEFEDE